MDMEQWLKEMQESMDERTRKAEQLREQLTAASATVSSSDGSVTLTLNPNGGLANISFGPRACDLGPAKLGSLIMTTVAQAQREVSRHVTAAFEEFDPNATATMEAILGDIPFDLDDDPEPATPAWRGEPELEPEPEPAPVVSLSARRAAPSRRSQPAEDDAETTDRPW